MLEIGYLPLVQHLDVRSEQTVQANAQARLGTLSEDLLDVKTSPSKPIPGSLPINEGTGSPHLLPVNYMLGGVLESKLRLQNQGPMALVSKMLNRRPVCHRSLTHPGCGRELQYAVPCSRKVQSRLSGNCSNHNWRRPVQHSHLLEKQGPGICC